MKTREVILCLISSLFLVSCLRKYECNIVPIKSNQIDSIQIKGDLVFENDKGNKDTLALIDNYNILDNETKKSLMTYEECVHSIGFDYDSKSKKGTISLRLSKNSKDEYELSVFGFCISESIKMSQIDTEKDSVIIVNVQECDESKFKTIALKKCKIEYFETQDGSVWKRIKIIPR